MAKKTFSRRRPMMRRKTTTRPAGKRAARNRARTTTVIRSIGPIAPRTICRMKYNEAFTSSATVMDYVFRLNSLFDPNLTGTGHQPYGRDTYATLYNRYRVFAVSWRITSFCNSAGSAGQVTILPLNSETQLSVQSLAAESPRAVTKVVTNAGGAVVNKGKMFLPRLNGCTPAVYKSDDRFQAQAGASPVEAMGLHIISTTMGGAAAAIMDHTVNLIFHCEWFDPLELGQS